MTVDLPAPPSANSLFVTRDGRPRKTKAYRRWTEGARLLMSCADMRLMPAKTPLRVVIKAAIDRTRDLDNIIKPLLDALQPDVRKRWRGVVPDDRWVDRVDARRVAAGEVEAGWCRVSVEVL